ncbi:MAG: hypothetical protein KatS3mg002_0847 [Candidatus Woesearchaeota archaeon]|nr:MAG: hypothetical protein KatS3mg002_0847 [Candidatus Woesearchaeota archaeon]
METKLDNKLKNITDHIKNNKILIIVRPNSKKTEIIGYDKNKNALLVNVHAKPENNEANKEIIRFFSKLLKSKVCIKSGSKSKEKLLEIRENLH